jgi:hypothetical protein
MKFDQSEVKRIFSYATAAAEVAGNQYIKDNGENWPCGFAWVDVKPRNSSFVKLCKALNYGRDSDYDKCRKFWNPGGISTQDMYAIQAGAVAFARVLEECGVTGVSVGSRMD